MKQNPTIYKIGESYNYTAVLNGISEHLNLNNKTFVNKNIQLGDHEGMLIVIESDEKASEWSSFFPNEYVNDISLNYKMPSLLMLVNTNSATYAIVGGAFYQYILPFLDSSFGLNTYSRIMDPIQDEIISIKTRGVTGLRAGMSEQFKDNYRIMDYIKFGKIPTELKIRLSSETVDLLFNQFVSTRLPNIILNISTGFNLNKKLSFLELGVLIDILKYIQTLKPNDFFSSYKEIIDKELITKSLKPALINALFNKRSDLMNRKISNFEICYPNKIEDFYSADEYKFKIKEEKNKFVEIGFTNDKSQVLNLILTYLNSKGYDRNLDVFQQKIYNIFIYTYKNNSKKHILKTGLIYHLNTELSLEGLGTFIYLDSKWYKLREIFIQEMNKRSADILTSNNLNNSVLDEKWTKKDNGKRQNESDYNEKYDKENYLILDKLTTDSIELADVLFVRDSTVYLCHVKYGFSTDLRELYSQIISSSRRLKNDLKDDENKYLKSIYRQLREKDRNRNLSELDFINMFKQNNIKYVMSITGHIKNKPLIENVEKYKSNIAKLSLIQCFTEMRTEYYDLDFEIINNEDCFI